jgi:hypothetical protein
MPFWWVTRLASRDGSSGEEVKWIQYRKLSPLSLLACWFDKLR